MRKALFILILFCLLFACQKANDCFSKAGKEVSIESSLSEFDSLFVNDVFEVHIIQDTINNITISGHESYVNETSFKITDNTLVLENNHKCKFSNPKNNKVKIYLKVNQIDRIRLNSSSKVISEKGLENDDEIGLIVSSKYNEADLNLNCKTFYYWNTHLNGGRINLKGEVSTLKLWNASLGSVDARNLYAENVMVDTHSKADCWVRPNNKLECIIEGQGNVYYYGNPKIIIVNDSSSIGKLIYSGE